MNAKEIRSWCLQQPRPKVIRVHCGDDRLQEVRGPVGNQSWVGIAQTIEALDPFRLEAFDQEGQLIRAMRDDQEDFDDPPAPPQVNVDVPSVLSTDPETARLTHFANLLFRAHQFSTELAFTKMVELFELSENRSQSIEARLERTEANYRRTLQQRVDDAFDQAEDIVANQAQQNANPMDVFIKSAMQAQAEAAARKAAAAAVNGTTGKPNGGQQS